MFNSHTVQAFSLLQDLNNSSAQKTSDNTFFISGSNNIVTVLNVGHRQGDPFKVPPNSVQKVNFKVNYYV